MKQPLTTRQQEVYDYCIDFLKWNDQFPPLDTIANSFGWSSMNAAYEIMKRIEERGHIELNEVGKYRRTRVIKLK